MDDIMNSSLFISNTIVLIVGLILISLGHSNGLRAVAGALVILIFSIIFSKIFKNFSVNFI
jgi:hypothetical protein